MTIIDPSGARIAGAGIQFRSQPDGVLQNFAADATGQLSVSLQPGTYTLLVESPGFRHDKREIVVDAASRQVLSVRLEIGGGGPNVTVQALPGTETATMPGLIGGCSEHEKIAEIKPSDPTSGYARELERSLDGLGITVRCVCASKWTEIFRGQAGAAWFRTDDGAFDVLFLPKGRTFAGVKIVQRREGDRYLTSFAGKPYSAVRMDGARRTYFIKRANLLFSVGSDEKLALLLESDLPK